MTCGYELAKVHAQLEGCHADSDFLVEEIFREIIRDAGAFISEKQLRGTSDFEIRVQSLY